MAINYQALHRRDGFRDFLLERNPNKRFVNTYFVYLNSPLVRRAISRVCGKEDIFCVSNIDHLSLIYDVIKQEPQNRRNHNVYSGAVSAYMKFLQGKPLRPIAKVKQEMA